MLARLGRWLRAAGHDTAIAAPGCADADLLDLARAEDRVLLTCDRALAARAAAAGRGLAVAPGSLDAHAHALGAGLGVDWLYRPFSRCLLDNAPLAAAPAPAHERLPPKARALGGAITTCPACRRLYWPGSHVRRMRARLAAWQGVSGQIP